MGRIAVPIALFALAAGCGTMTTDRVPSGAPKGWVEFYVASGENLGFQIPIYEVEDGMIVPVRIALEREEGGVSVVDGVKFTMTIAREVPIDLAEYADWRREKIVAPPE
jgi:hypothetical protein